MNRRRILVTHTDYLMYLCRKFHPKTDPEQIKGEEEMSFVLTHERRGGARKNAWGGLRTADETYANVNTPDQHKYFVFINKIEKYIT